MSDGLRLNNLLSSGWKYLTSSDIRISILYNIKISQVRVPRARLLVKSEDLVTYFLMCWC
jgi:hypothetical protein